MLAQSRVLIPLEKENMAIPEIEVVKKCLFSICSILLTPPEIFSYSI